MKKKGFLKNGVYLTLSRFTKYILLYVFTMIITRYLGTEEYGKFTYYLSQITIISLFFTLGTDTYIIIQIAKDQGNKNKLISENIKNRIILISLISIILLSINTFSKSKFISVSLLLIYCAYIFDSFRTVADGYFQAIEEMKLVAISEALRGVLLLIFVLIFKGLDLGLVGLAMAYFSSTLLVLLLNVYYLFVKHGVRLENTIFENQKKLIKCSLPFFMVSLINILSLQIDTIMIRQLAGYSETGIYGTAKKILDVVLVIPSIISTVLLPRLSKGKVDNKTNNKIMAIIFGIGLVVTIGIVTCAKYVIVFSFGIEYVKSYYNLCIFSVGIPLIFLNAYFGSYFSANSMQKNVMYINLISTILNVVLNYKLIPLYYANGAAIATVATIISSFTMYFILYKRKGSTIVQNLEMRDVV